MIPSWLAISIITLTIPFTLNWSPVGTFVTWQMMQLNPIDA